MAMVDVAARRGRRRARERLVAAVAYGAMGWPVCPGAHPLRGVAPAAGGRACSCDRVGCPDPGAHPLSPAWQLQATADAAAITGWWTARPEANVLLVTGRIFDVLDVPANVGRTALGVLDRDGTLTGPVAACGPHRYLFFVASRGVPDDEDEWWSCHLDCVLSEVTDSPGIRWHCRDSYVLAPPSRHASGQPVHWVRGPGPRAPALPDALRILPVLADACEEAYGR